VRKQILTEVVATSAFITTLVVALRILLS